MLYKLTLQIMFSLFFSTICFGENIDYLFKGKIIVVKNTIFPSTEFIKINSGSGIIRFSISNPTKFIDEDGRKSDSVSVKYEEGSIIKMPSIVGAEEIADSEVSISDENGSLLTKIPIFTTKKSWLSAINKGLRDPNLKDAVLLFGENYAIVDYDKITVPKSARGEGNFIKNRSITTNSDDAGFGEEINESGAIGKVEFSCYRPWAPLTRQDSGIVHWKIPKPRILHSLKDENSGSNSSCSLQCPRKTGNSTDSYVDGVYNVAWGPNKAMKIPNHCSIVVNSRGYATCCNKVVYYLGGGKVSFIDPRLSSLSDWADLPRVCNSYCPRVCKSKKGCS